MINQRQSVLLSEGAAAQPLKAFDDRDDAFNMHDYLWQLQPKPEQDVDGVWRRGRGDNSHCNLKHNLQ